MVRKKQPPNMRMSLVIALVFPLAVMLFTENCSKMKSSTGDEVSLSSDPDICSDAYKPPANLTSKAVADDEVPQPTLFDLKKSYLDAVEFSKTPIVGKAGTSEREVVVTITTDCDSPSDSLSAKARAQNTQFPHYFDFDQAALPYRVPADSDVKDLEAQAEADVCVLGLTPQRKLRKAALDLPPVNDTHLAKQGYLTKTNFLHAYQNLIKKQSSAVTVKVGFLDTGIYCSHTDIAANLVAGCGYDAVRGQTPTDNDGHGSHTSGLVGAVLNNGTGIAGIGGNNIEVHAIRVLDGQDGTANHSYQGAVYANNQNLDVLNISLESQEKIVEIENGVKLAVNGGTVVVMAAGNQGVRLGDIHVSPAMVGKDVAGAITVGSIDESTGMLSSFSNYGVNVEIATYGAINSGSAGAAGGLYSLSNLGGYHRLMGTSQSAPIVTGAVVLAIHFLKQHNVSYTPAVIERIIMASTDANPLVNVKNNRVLNFSKLTRNLYAYAGVSICD